MTAIPSPFLPIPGDHHPGAPQAVACNPVDLFEPTNLKERLEALPEPASGHSRFGLVDIDCFRLLAYQIVGSELQGFDVAVLLFMLGHFNHKRHVVPLTISGIGRQLGRQASQVRRSIRKLERLDWITCDSSHLIWFNPLCLRSANRKHQAIAFRHVPDPWNSKSPYSCNT